jgi:hypothetical protein
MVAQTYLETATGKLTQLDHISQIDSVAQTKYYTVKDFFVDKQLARFRTSFVVSGKYNGNLDMYIYVVVPIYDINHIKPYKDTDTLRVVRYDNGNYDPYAWLTMRYEKTISNRLSSSEKDQRYNRFAKECEADFKAKPLNKFSYLDRLPFDEEMKRYQATVNSEYYPVVPEPKHLLVPVYESFDARNGSKLPWIFGSFCIGSVVFLVLLLLKPLRSDLEYATSSRDKTQQIIDEITGNSN